MAHITRNINPTPSIVGRRANWELRARIFRSLAAGGAVTFRTAPRIARRLDLTKGDGTLDTVTVNNHLRSLGEAGLIEVVGEEKSGSRGRPAKVFGLTALGRAAAAFK